MSYRRLGLGDVQRTLETPSSTQLYMILRSSRSNNCNDNNNNNNAKNDTNNIKNKKPNKDTAISIPPTLTTDDSNRRSDVTEEISGWVNTLRQWPLQPNRPVSKEEEEVGNKDDDMVLGARFNTDNPPEPTTATSASIRSLPLTRIVNLEALLAFALFNSPETTSTTATISQRKSSSSSSSSTPISGEGMSSNKWNGTSTQFPATTASSSRNNNNGAIFEELSDWEKWINGLKQNIGDLGGDGKISDRSVPFGLSGDILRQATSRIESLVLRASSAVSPAMIQNMIYQASRLVQNQTATRSLIDVVQNIAPFDPNLLDIVVNTDDDVDDDEATIVQRTKTFTTDFLAVADGIFRKGYVVGDDIPKQKNEFLSGLPALPESRSLFADFPSAREINNLSPTLVKDAEMGALAGAIYEETIPRAHALGHTIVARGLTRNVKWMITDSVANETCFSNSKSTPSPSSYLIRTITIRGFDAADSEVDRQELLNSVCDATPEYLEVGTGVLLHSGLRSIAKDIYRDIQKYIDWTSPSHKLALNGHSIGGSLSLLILLEIVLDRGLDFVLDKINKVYMFGAPPVAAMRSLPATSIPGQCPILNTFGLPTSLVSLYVQPWDPIPRLFTRIDPIYPLVGDIGTDGVTPYSSGPPRALRPIVRTVLESWEGWPDFRDAIRRTLSQNYTSVGTSYLFMPDPTRYLADRFLAVNIPVPAIETIVRLSPNEMLPALESIFLLDTFEISYIPQTLRSFVHHFYPAYDNPLLDYVKRLERRAIGQSVALSEVTQLPIKPKAIQEKGNAWQVASQWFQG